MTTESSSRVYFASHGHTLIEPAYAVRGPGDASDQDAVYRAISARNGLQRCGAVSRAGHGTKAGRITSDHYVATLGRPCPGGGWIPEAEVWIVIDRGQS